MPPPLPTRPSIAPHLAASLFAFAAECSASGNPLKCRLTSVLQLLYVAAGVLALAAIVVLIFAVRTYRKNRIPDKKNNRIPQEKTKP